MTINITSDAGILWLIVLYVVYLALKSVAKVIADMWREMMQDRAKERAA